jgi:hypothetical protein
MQTLNAVLYRTLLGLIIFVLIALGSWLMRHF